MTAVNVDPTELAKFESLAHRWWDPEGEFRPLHDINPPRLAYIEERVRLDGSRVLDVGCGGGILAESMAHNGAEVVGIDLGEAPLAVARLHALESGAEIEYRRVSVEELAAEEPGGFDVVTCMEMLEHVPDPASVVDAIARLVRPGGHVFLSTLNRTPQSYIFAIVGAEYILRLLPRGTHEFDRFIRPSELEGWLRRSGLDLRDLSGLDYNPLLNRCRLSGNVSVNYLMHAVRTG